MLPTEVYLSQRNGYSSLLVSNRNYWQCFHTVGHHALDCVFYVSRRACEEKKAEYYCKSNIKNPEFYNIV